MPVFAKEHMNFQLPKMVDVKQIIPDEKLDNVYDKVLEEVAKPEVTARMEKGKTACVLSAIQTLEYEWFEVDRVLIIAPLSVAKSTWLSAWKSRLATVKSPSSASSSAASVVVLPYCRARLTQK